MTVYPIYKSSLQKALEKARVVESLPMQISLRPFSNCFFEKGDIIFFPEAPIYYAYSKEESASNKDESYFIVCTLLKNNGKIYKVEVNPYDFYANFIVVNENKEDTFVLQFLINGVDALSWFNIECHICSNVEFLDYIKGKSFLVSGMDRRPCLCRKNDGTFDHNRIFNTSIFSFEILDSKTFTDTLANFQIRTEFNLESQSTNDSEVSDRLKTCVSDWYTHQFNDSIKHKWFVDYYSYNEHKDSATFEMWDVWKFIWHFKNDPDSSFPPSYNEHKLALDKAVQLLENMIIKTFYDEDLPNLTLVCCSASTGVKNRRRFESFSRRVCCDLGMHNAFGHISIVEDGNAKHLGGSGLTAKEYDVEWFREKNIILFDDLRTSGASLEREKARLESFGATVICAITLGQTTN